MKMRNLPCRALGIASVLAAPAIAQTSTSTAVIAAPAASTFSWLQGQRPYIGLSLGRIRGAAACEVTAITCDAHRPAQLYAGTMINSFWGAEIGYLQSSRAMHRGIEIRSQGLNLSLVGKTRISPALGIFGKMGTAYGRTESLLPGSRFAGSTDQGFGFSFGAGLTYDFTPRLSARLEWESNDFRLGGAGPDPVASTSLGLQYRY